MRTLLKGGKILTLNRDDRIIEKGDLLIRDNEIEAVGENIKDPADARVIDCTGKLIMPGLVNSHLHSDENLFKGLFDNLPLELWMLFSCPPLNYGPFSERLIYLRTMLGAIEMIESGVTSVQDDVSECPCPTEAGYNSVFKAYRDLGMRANVALNINDRLFCDKLPYASDIIPEELQQQLQGRAGSAEIIDLYKDIIETWNNRDNLKVVLSSSAPQRCTDRHLKELNKLSLSYNLPLHTHVLETKMQRVTGEEFYGKSIIKHLAELELLSERLTIIHSVWVDNEDIELMGRAGVSVAHNPTSNLKLGSGIMPLRELVEAGVNVVLGTDGASSNDSLNMFETMKFAALLHKVTDPDYTRWPDAGEVLKMTTRNAARSLRRQEEIGCLEEGKRADIIILDLNNTSFIPLNNIQNQLVYSENGSSVETVIIDGRMVMYDGKIQTVNKDSTLKEAREVIQRFQEGFAQTAGENNKLFPYIDEIYWKCVRRDTAVNRFAR